MMAASTGCATKPKPVETPAVAFVDSMTVPMAFDEAWQLTRDVLLVTEGVEIYTRDKRGMFVVYTDMHRKKLIVPHRSMLTITLEADTKESTKISVETVAQRYGVTPLTYPGWKDNDTVSEEEVGREILESIQAQVSKN
jgi:hypothetical protein